MGAGRTGRGAEGLAQTLQERKAREAEMKLAEIKTGATYTVKVSGNLVPVVVTAAAEASPFRRVTRFEGVNRATGKTVHFTAAKCRRQWTDEEVTKYLSATVGARG